MTKKPLSTLFDALYHGKFDFGDFMYGRVEENYDVVMAGAASHRRNIFRPNKNLKAYQTFLKIFVFEYLGINKDVVYSYRKGCSAYDAVAKHAHSKYFFQADISSFFANTNRALVKETILRSRDECPVLDLEDSIERILDLVCANDSLPIGFPSSAPISNAILFNFDNAFSQHCQERNLIYTRYSDDIIVSADTKDSFGFIVKDIQEYLIENASEKFHLNPKKSRYFQVGGKVKILGMMILPNGKITIDSKLKSSMEVLLHFYINNKKNFIEMIEGDEEAGLGKLTGYLNYANSIDATYLAKLRKKFGATIVDTLMHRTLD
jgi:RNA-directed DNA polymerase